MMKVIKNIVIILSILICAGLGALAGWFAREKLNPPVPDGTVTEKTYSAPMGIPDQDQGIVSFLSGSGFRKRSGAWEELEPGTLIGRGDSVRTAEAAAADIQFGGLAVIRLRQNSAASFDNINTKFGGSLSVKIIAGTVLFNVTKGAGKVTVTTPDGNLSVMGTEFLVTVNEDGTYTAVRDGKVAVEGGAEVGAGYSVRIGEKAAAKPEALSETGKADAAELAFLRMLELEQGKLRLARIIVESSPAGAALFRDGEPCGKGSAALLVPLGKAIKLRASMAGFLSKEIEVTPDQEKGSMRYLIQLEPDPDAKIKALPEESMQRILKMEAQIKLLENEIQSREILYRAVASQSSNLGTERDLILRDAEKARKETDAAKAEKDAALKQIQALEGQVKELRVALEQEKEKVRQVMELLKN